MTGKNRKLNGSEELKMAEEALEGARSEMKNGRFLNAANRAYYAVFHVASAALMAVDIQTRTHFELRTMFKKHLVNTGRLDSQYFDILEELAEYRGIADYGRKGEPWRKITAEVAFRIVNNAEKFFNDLRIWLQSEWEKL